MAMDKADRFLAVKKYAYLLVLLTPLSMWVSYGLWAATQASLWLWLTPAIVFGVVPVLERFIGRDSDNINEETQFEDLTGQAYYRWLIILCAPLYCLTLVLAAWVFSLQLEGWLAQSGWLFSMGTAGAVVAINVGHELIHKNTILERFAGGCLLAMVCYAGFKVEHVRGHHVWVSTPNDPSSSKFGQSLYHFWPRAVWHNTMNAWRLENQRLRLRQLPWWRNELIGWYTLSAFLGFVMLVVWGIPGLGFFLVQSVIAFGVLEIINYIEHYGLARSLQENGRYEKTNVTHSWNSNFLLTNVLLFQLQRHSDHHAYPQRRYQVLRHHDESPQLPAGYATMILIALVPPLWFRIMNPRVQQYHNEVS
ncbi:alkane 1-monooxygenase [uncultured Umboniibacter sp.]|uniref:alkane 1-monooxygenase n=1 Tax=uncultured Umboniibacter sp. TaxID=1798917 RepID=UPI0026354E92|nr:alkane 1-monooxygenase [uncultured Umboniibacter sp.]